MFNLNAVVKAFNLTVVEAGSYKDSHGFVLTYRPMFNNLEPNFGTYVAPTSFVNVEDLFYNLVSYDEIKLEVTLTQSMEGLLARLEAVKYDYKDYHVDELCIFVTKYEDRYSTHTYDEVRFYGMLRQQLVEEAFRVGSEQSTLASLFNITDETLHYRKEAVN